LAAPHRADTRYYCHVPVIIVDGSPGLSPGLKVGLLELHCWAWLGVEIVRSFGAEGRCGAETL